MIERLVLLILFAILNSYLFGKKHRVAFLANSVLFVFLFTLNIFIVEYEPIVNFWVDLLGEEYYFPIRDSFYTAVDIVNISTSSLLVIQLFFFIAIPLLSIMSVIKKIREECQKISINNCFKVDIKVLDYNDSSNKEFICSENNKRLKYGVMLI